ncbi:MFS transporter [Streptacidiphilus jiangxiensis]|uniref:Predicted arabinose efflux permease, MFS family n=1 Tax=Streptacidiphilus jiangxiensis TaxID=235985 RepID=A0A1H7T4T2_STRJI|nr:MFS transporter [Streptacidiphilus jiangxiensis]SEL79851.1 Predicted arabinose efflux permease, MFS family [Streptacidiphilus jiangxiensis]
MTINERAEVDAPGGDSTGGGVARPGPRAWVVLGLLFCLMVVNFATKVVPALAGDPLMHELGIGTSTFGVVQSSFFWLFAAGAILGGWLATRVSAHRLLAVSAGLWVVSLVPMAWHVGLGTVITCRVVLGFAEGPTVALALQIAHAWFPAERRALPSALIVAGAAVGPLVSAPALNALIARQSWHAAFAVLAVVGTVVALAWAFVGRDGTLAVADAAHPQALPLPERVPVARLLTTPTLVGLTVLALASYADTAVKLSWLPLYFHDGLGYSTATASRLTALPFLAAAISLIGFGVLSRRLTRRGWSLRATRGRLPGILVAVGALGNLLFPLAGRGGPALCLIVLGASLVAAGYGISFAGLSDVVPARQRGLAFGVVTAVYSLGGIIGPAVMGGLVHGSAVPLDGYTRGFLGLGVALLAGGVPALVLVHPERDAARLRAAAEGLSASRA